MRQRFYSIKFVLWLAFAAAMMFGFLSRFKTMSVISIAGVVCALTYWLTRHRQDLHAVYLAREAKPKAISLGRLKLEHIAPGIVLLGLIAFHFASGAMHGAPHSSLAERLISGLFGTPGVVGLWVIAGTVLLSFGLETMLGARYRNET